MYQLRKGFDGVLRLSDGAWIPPDTSNRDWCEYQAWLAKGNKPLPADSK